MTWRNADHVIMIGIAGPSASGKSSVAQRALVEIPGLELIQLDMFYRNKEEFPMAGDWPNWEVPENIKFDELLLCLSELKAGRDVEVPIYSKSEGRLIGHRLAHASQLVLVEGFLLLHDKRIRGMIDLVIYLKADAFELRERRLKREPGLDPRYFDEVVVPNFELYGASAEGYADAVLEAHSSEDDVWKDLRKLLLDQLGQLNFPMCCEDNYR